MGTCWASSLGQCAEKISREHIVSKGLFVGEHVDVRGFPWCKGETKRIGLANLTAKVLCKAHNEGLSTVDSAGKHAFDALRMMMQTRNAREKMKRGSWKVKQYRIDGALLERWFLKTLINLCLHGATPIGRDTSQPGVVPEHLVRAAYGRERLSGDAGLYSVVQAGMQISSTDSFAFAPLIKDLKHVEGGLFLFRGFCYLLFLEPDGPPHPLTGISIEGIDVGQCQLNFHNRRVTDNERGCKSQVLEVEWD